MLVLVFIILAGIGLAQNASWGEACKEEGPSFLTFLGGLSACAAMIAIAMTVYGEEPKTAMAVVGLVGTVVFNLVPIKTGLDYQAKTKYAKDISAFQKFKMGPVWAWARHTLVGIGKCAKIVMYCTIIGIPMVKSMENAERRANAYAKQRELQEMKEYLDEQARLNRAASQGAKDKRK